MVNNYYQCECGREFNNPQAFNGHKSHCIIHMQMTNKLESLSIADKIRHSKTKATMCKAAEAAKQEKLAIWVAEQHICETCGKVMTVKFGSGRFCSRACANSHKHSEETKSKISSSLQASTKNELGYNKVQYEKYNLKPNHCIDCNTVLPYALRLKQRCPACAKIYTKLLRSTISKNTAEKYGGNINRYGVRGRCKYGTYKGIPCDSSWELAFVYYCFSNNIQITRNHTGYTYIKNNEQHTYYPDFIINDSELIEIKNYWTEDVQLKIEAIPADYKYTIIYKNDIKKYLDFVKQHEGKNFCEKLYDKTKPSYLDKLNTN